MNWGNNVGGGVAGSYEEMIIAVLLSVILLSNQVTARVNSVVNTYCKLHLTIIAGNLQACKIRLCPSGGDTTGFCMGHNRIHML
jgi:hypothetical protein